MKPFAPLALALLAVACSRPPKTTADVDTMREASFVPEASQKDDRTPRGPRVELAPSDADASSGEEEEVTPEAAPGMKAVAPPEPRRPGPKGAAKGPRGKLTRVECTRMFERFFELVLDSDQRFADLGADGKAMVRQAAAQDPSFIALQKDCEKDVTRAKYDCAMASKTSAAWQACLK